MLSDNDEAEDVVQEALIAVLRRYPDLRSAPDSYMMTAVRSRALNAQRTSNRYKRVVSSAISADVSYPADTQQQAFMHQLTQEALFELDRLPARSKEVAWLHWIEGLSCAQTATRIGVTTKTVEKRVAKLRRRLRGRLGERHGLGVGDSILELAAPPASPDQVWTGTAQGDESISVTT